MGKSILFLWATVLTVALLTFQASAAGGGGRGPKLSSGRDEAAALQNESVGGPFTSLCTSATTFGSNVQTNCDSTVLPHNETAIAADPANPAHLVGGTNDTELPPNGASGSAKSALGYYTSFDGGATWLNAQVPTRSFTPTTDASVVF